MSFNTFYLNSELSSGVIDGSNVIIGGNLGISTNNPQHNLDVSGTINTINLIASTATISELDISGETIKATSIQTKVESTEVVILDVNVSSKTSNAFNSSGSSNAYFINNIETPFIHLTSGKTYRFNQSDTTNNTHPIKFYLDQGKSSQYNTNITTNGTVNAGSLGDYVEITITSSTPQILYYQCQNHSFMGGKIYVKGTNVTSITSVGTLTAGTWNASTIQKQYLDTQNISVNDLSDISFNSTSTTNGQALVWNTTDKVWEAGVVAGSGGGGLTDLSATSISDLSDVSLNGIQTNQSLKWDGEKLIPYTLGTTATSVAKQGQVLETITGVCDGRTVVVDSGSYTLPNVTAYQDTTHTGWTDVTGSSISYTPPTGSKQVIFEFHLNLSVQAATSGRAILLFKLLIDGTSVTSQNQEWGDSTTTYSDTVFYRGIIDITGTDDVANGKLSSWTSNKTLKLQVVNYDSYAGRLHAGYMAGSPPDSWTWDGTNLIKPRLKITTIGESSGQAVTLSNNSVSDLSDVSFNPISTTNGQALVWNSTDSVWEAGTVASSGGVQRSSTEIKVSHSSSDVKSTTEDGEIYSTYNLTNLFDTNVAVSGTAHSSDVFQGTNNTYSGSTASTNSYSGMWIQQEYNSPVYFTKFVIYARANSLTMSPRELKVFVGNDGTNWTEYHSFTKTSYTASEMVTTNFASTTTPYTFIRFVFHKTVGDNYLSFNELEIYGNKDEEPSSINDLSDVSFNPISTTNGQALVWNSTNKIWEPGTVASSGGGGLTDLSATSISDLSDVSFNSATTTNGQALVWNTTDNIWEPGTVASSSSNTTNVMSLNPGDFKVLEKIAGICDGRTISGESIGHVLKNVTTYQDISTTLVDVEGSSISYTPPNNAKQVLYNFRFNVVDISDEANVFNQNHTLTLRLYIDGVEITNQRAQISSYMYNHGHYFNYAAIIDIGSVDSDNVESGKYVSWTSDKVIKLAASKSHGDYPARLFSIKMVSSGSYVHTFVPPSIELASIGDVSDISFSAISIADLSDVSFNSTTTTNGQALVWNTTDKVWEAGVVAGSGGGGLTDLSATSMTDLSDVSFNVKNSSNTETILLTGDGGNISINGTLSTDTISEKTDGSGVTIDSVLLKDNNVTAHTISAQNYAVGATNFISASRQGNFRDIEVKNSSNTETILLTGDGGNISINGTLSTDTISEKNSSSGVTIEGILMKNGDLSANDASFNVIDVSAIIINGVDLISGAPAALDTLNELAAALDNSANFAANVTAQLGAKQATISSSARLNADLIHDGTISNAEYGYLNGVTSAIQTQLDAKQSTLTAGTNITINGTTISASAGGGLTDLSATSINDLSDVSLNGIQVNQTVKWDGEKLVPTTLATSVTKQGQVLETLIGVFDGRTVTVDSGTYTLGNVTAIQIVTNTTTWTDLTNTSISYKPPIGTRHVKIRYTVATDDNGSYYRPSWRLLIDGNAYTSQQMGEQHFQAYESETKNRIFVIDINGTADMANGMLDYWNTTKTIKLQVTSPGKSTAYNQTRVIASGAGILLKPSIEIVAIGETPGQAVTLTNNSVNDLSDISFNSTSTTNGQALVWNSTDSVWEAGAVASSGSSIDETTDVSLNDLSVHGDISGSVSSFIKFGETQTTQTNNKLYSWVVDNSGTFDISHIGYQSSGSEGTNWPKSRQEHSNIFDNSNNIIIFGGKDSGNNHLSNIWEYNTGTNTYTKKVSTVQTGGSSGIKPNYSTDNTWLPYENLTAMGYPNERSDNRSLTAFDDKLYWLSDTELWVKDLTVTVSNPSTAGNTNWSQVTGITGSAPNNSKRGAFFHYNYDGTDYLYYLFGVLDDDTSPESGDFNTYAYRFNISTKTWSLTSATNSTDDYKRMYAAYHVYDGYCFSYGGNVNGSNYSNTFVKTGLGGSGDKAFGYCTTLSPSAESGSNSITGRTYVSWAGQNEYMFIIGGRASNGNAQKCIFRYDCANNTYRQITSTSDSIVGKIHWEEGVAGIYDNKIIMASSYNAGTSGATNYLLSVDISTTSNSYSLAYYPDGSSQTDASRRINTQANNSVGAAAAWVVYKNRWYFMFPYGTGINSDGSYSDSVDYNNGYGGGKSPYMWTYVFSDYNSIVEHNLINHTSNLHNDNMYIFGGKNSSNSYKNNLIKVLLSNYTYSLLTLASSLPSIRDSHSSVILNDKMYIFGGWDGSTVNNETWELDLSVDPPTSTQKLSNVISSTNINLYGHSAVIYDNNMYIFGGYNGSTLYNNIYKYDITNNSWSLLNTNGTSPSARYYHTAIVTKDEMIVYGGKNTSNITIQDSYLFDFNNNTWYLLNNDVATTHTQTSTSIPNYSFGSKALHYNSGNDYKIYLYGGYNSQNTTLIGGNGIIHTSDISHNLTEYVIVESGNTFTFNTNSDGRVGIGRQNPTKKLDVGGDGIFSGTVTSNGSILTSDDRIKHNEERITNALSTISKITPKHYFKTSNKLYDSSHNFILNTNNEPVTTSNHRLTINEDYTIETGIIAQEIQNIPELRFAIQNTIPLGIDYNSIHCTHIAATNELHQLVKTQQTEIEQQQQEIENLKLVNQDLNNQFNQFIQELQNIKQHLGI